MPSMLLAAPVLLLSGPPSDPLDVQATPSAPIRAATTVVDHPDSRPEFRTGTPDTSTDGLFAFWARLRHDNLLRDGVQEVLDLNAPSSSHSTEPEPIRKTDDYSWPFGGKAPNPPTAFQIETPESIARVEWRRRGSRLAVSFASGQPTLQAECYLAMQALEASIQDSAPQPDWARDKEIPATWLESDGSPPYHEPAMDRTSWASAWADCYPIGKSGMTMIIATDTQRDVSRITVMGLGADRRDRVTSDELEGVFGDEGATGSAFLIHADFDANGTPDYFLGGMGSSLGLAQTWYGGAFVLADSSRRVARITRFEESNIALIDHDGNGRAEILTRTLVGAEKCLDGRPHNFWIWNLLGFQDLRIVDLRNVDAIRSGGFVGRFPHVEWFSHDPKDRFRKLLSDEQREEMTRPRFPLYQPRPKKPAQSTR